ncbi:eukaryotic translation initiation factor 1A [Tanacetum coccineum]
MLGNCRCDAMCIDGTMRLFHIRGKMHKKVWIAAGDIILVGLSYYQDDVIFMKRMLILAMIISSLKMCGESADSVFAERCRAQNHTNTEMNESTSGRCSAQNHTNTEMNESRSGRCIAQNHTNTEMNESRSGMCTADNRQTAADLDRQEQIQTDRA